MKTIFQALIAGACLFVFGTGAYATQPAAPTSGVLTPVLAQSVNDVTTQNSAAAQNVEVSLIADRTAIEPGQPIKIGARFTLSPGWHIYYREPGDNGFPTDVNIKLPAGFQLVSVEWEKPTRFEESGFTTYGYTGETVIAVTVLPPADLKTGETIELNATISWLACKDSCIPGNAEKSISLTVADAQNPAQAANVNLFNKVGFNAPVSTIGGAAPGTSVLDQDLKPSESQDGKTSFIAYLFFAFIGGMLLNCMPCVLPVISLKVLRFVQEAGDSRAKVFRLGLSYAAGTIFTCVTLALAVVLAKFLGYNVGWGFQFQSPLFLVGMATLLTLMSLGLFGVFFVQLQAGKNLDKLANRKGHAGAFFTGVVATILSTPCTAPFLGSAVGFAFSQPWWVVVAIFFAVGSGLALPYVVLTMNPAWTKLIPKPGAWMEHFKEAMGFVLLGSVVWLLFVLGRQVGPDGVTATVAFLISASFGTWLYNRLGGFEATRTRKAVLTVVALAIAGSTFYFYTMPALSANFAGVAHSNTGGIDWKKFAKSAVDKSLSEGKVVFIDFTADWCQTCKLNEATVLDSDAVVEQFNKLGVKALKADWTTSDPEITQLLSKFGRAGVPLYVIMSPHRPNQPIVLPTLLTQQMLIEKLEEASRP